MGYRTFNPRLKTRARALRADMTESERLLWQRVRRRQILGIQFYRQRPLGPYIVDSYGASVGLVLEVDGSQHQEIEHWEKDRTRDAYLRDLGLQVLRFDNRQVLTETDGVLTISREVLQERLRVNPPSVPPFSKGGRARTNRNLGGDSSSSGKRRGKVPRSKPPPLKKGAGNKAAGLGDGPPASSESPHDKAPRSKSPPLKKGG